MIRGISRRLPRVLSVCAALALAAGCGRTSPDDLVADAARAIETGDLRTAEIQLKNLLRQDGAHAEARLLLGNVLLAKGDAIGAEHELRRARELGIDPAVVHVPLLQALRAQGKLEAVLAEVEAGPALDDDGRIAVALHAGAAHAGLGRLAAAELVYREALALRPDSAELRTELARVLIQAGRVSEGLSLVAAVLGDEPDFVPALLLRGAVDLREARYRDAEATFERVVRLTEDEPRSTAHVLGLTQLVEAELAQRKLDEAEVNADRLLAASPQAAAARLLKAGVEVEQGRLESAKRRLSQLVADYPRFWQAHTLLGIVNLRQEELGQAQMHLQAAVTNRPEDVRARVALAELYMRQGRVDEARAVITNDGAATVSDAMLYAMLGRASLAVGQPGQAAEYFEQSERAGAQSRDELLGVLSLYVAAGELERALRVSEASPDSDALTSYLETLVAMREGRTNDAAEAAKALSEALPDAAWPLNIRGGVALAAGNATEARELFERALELEPTNARAAIGLAALATEQGKFDEARAWLERVPASPERLKLEGQLAMAEGRFGDAASAFKRAFAARPAGDLARLAYAAGARAGLADPGAELRAWAEDNPSDFEAALMLSDIALAGGDLDAAQRHLEAVIAVRPAHTAALNNLAWLYGERGDSRAEEIARRALQTAPDNPSIADTLGWILASRGAYGEALPFLRRAAEALPEQPDVRYHLAVALAETGASDEARDLLRDLLDGGKDFSGRADAVERLRRLER